MKSFHRIPTTDARKSWWGFVFFWVLVAVPAVDIAAGVLVAPSVVFISDKGRTGRMTLMNTGNSPMEVSIGFSFGLPVSDSLGNVSVRLQDSAVTDPRSALGWIKAFPRKLIMPPNGSQIVRLVARPPKDLPDGEYWARVVVQSAEGATSVPTPTADNQITTKLNMIVRTAIALKYRTGDLVANLELNSASARRTDSRVEALVDMTNRGNVSYVGMLNCRLLDANGKEISVSRTQLAVYHNLKRRVDLPITEGDFATPYKVEISISNRGRKDIADEDMIYGNEIHHTMYLEG